MLLGNIDHLSEGITQLHLKASVKYHKHLRIVAINEAFPNKHFTFSIIGKKKIIDQIKKLNQVKTTQDT